MYFISVFIQDMSSVGFNLRETSINLISSTNCIKKNVKKYWSNLKFCELYSSIPPVHNNYFLPLNVRVILWSVEDSVC
jgi:hypothetical protein